MPTTLLRLTISIFTLFFLCQCAKEEVKVPEKIDPNVMVGRISSVSSDNKIILIEKFTPGPLPDDLIYSSRNNNGNSASIKPTGERIRQFHAADLVNGVASVGDAVFSRRLEDAAPVTALADPNKPTPKRSSGLVPLPITIGKATPSLEKKEEPAAEPIPPTEIIEEPAAAPTLEDLQS